MRAVFAVGVGLASFLLFCCEPMAAKELLPVFGGAAAVWLSCLVFFQAGVLAGYGLGGWLARGEMQGRRMVIYGVLLVFCAASAIGWAAGVGSGVRGLTGWPVLGIFALLGVRVGVPFVVLAATTPLLQAWWVRVTGEGVPYRLFGLSNAASLGALVLYPSAVEPHMRLGVQRGWWCAGVIGFCGVSGWLGWRVRDAAGTHVSEARHGAPRVSAKMAWMWFLLPLGGALQLSAVTEHLTRNVAAMPLLWVLPLGVYLVSFIVAFELPGLYRRGVVAKLLGVMLAGTGYLLARPDLGVPLAVSVGLLLVEMFLACWMLHAEVYLRRPRQVGGAAGFYLAVAAGGVLGSALVGIVAPLALSMNYDLALVLVATAVLVAVVVWREGWPERAMWVAGCLALVGLMVHVRMEYRRGTLLATRNFYGSLRVRGSIAATGEPMRVLLNGTIEHGTEVFSAQRMMQPTTYYAPESGVGLAMAACCEGRGRRIGVVGLGVGTMAAFGREGDEIRFYEIDPAVRPVAESLFAYLRGSKAAVTVVEGDGRASLEGEVGPPFDVLVVDAFAGDAIPVHLLTVEAMRAYRRRLRPGGVMVFHVSNQFVELAPEVAELAQAAGMEARMVTSVANEARGEFRAVWVIVAEDAGYFERAPMVGKVNRVERVRGVGAWTDEDSSLLRLLRW